MTICKSICESICEATAETTELRLARIEETGWHDHDDAEWIVGRYRELADAAFRFLLDLNDQNRVRGIGERDKDGDSTLLTIAQRQSIVPPFDYFHHAPRCAANHYHETVLPGWTCTCGARGAGEPGGVLSPDGQRLQAALDKAGVLDPQERRLWLLGMRRGLTP